jgi:hypothetical protein
MASSPENESAEKKLVAVAASHQHELSFKSNRFHPWQSAKCLGSGASVHTKPNITAANANAAAPSSASDGTKSPEEQQQQQQHDDDDSTSAGNRVISHSINSIINGR